MPLSQWLIGCGVLQGNRYLERQEVRLHALRLTTGRLWVERERHGIVACRLEQATKHVAERTSVELLYERGQGRIFVAFATTADERRRGLCRVGERTFLLLLPPRGKEPVESRVAGVPALSPDLELDRVLFEADC